MSLLASKPTPQMMMKMEEKIEEIEVEEVILEENTQDLSKPVRDEIEPVRVNTFFSKDEKGADGTSGKDKKANYSKSKTTLLNLNNELNNLSKK